VYFLEFIIQNHKLKFNLNAFTFKFKTKGYTFI